MQSKEQNKHKNQKHRHREQTDGSPEERGVGGQSEKSEGIKMYKLVVTKSSWGYGIGNIVNNIIITMYSASCLLEILGENHFVKCMIVYPLSCTPEVNIILNVNCN